MTAKSAVASLFFVAMALASVVASATPSSTKATDRPIDAPDSFEHADEHHALPPVPPEYTAFESAGIRVAYHPLAHERLRALLGRLTAIRSELGARLGRPVLAEVEIRVASMPAEMALLSPTPLPPFVSSVALTKYHLVLASLGSPPSIDAADLEATLRHELAHLALDEVTLEGPREEGAPPIVPRWFHEGFAVDFGGESKAARAEALFSASMRGAVLPLASLDAESQEGSPHAALAAAEAADFARFLGEPRDAPRVAKVAERLRGGEAFDAALASATGEPLTRIEAMWRKDAAKRYGFLPALFVGALLWFLVAALVLAKRLRARAAEKRRLRRIALRKARELRLAGRARAPKEGRANALFKDPEVPKVEHHGRWYTLH